jgi:hypothetical protein
MNSIRKSLGMGKTEITKEPSRPWNPHFYAVFAQVHNTLQVGIFGQRTLPLCPLTTNYH